MITINLFAEINRLAAGYVPQQFLDVAEALDGIGIIIAPICLRVWSPRQRGGAAMAGVAKFVHKAGHVGIWALAAWGFMLIGDVFAWAFAPRALTIFVTTGMLLYLAPGVRLAWLARRAVASN